nr:gliding motility-associated C-terminal domain-containing protein [Saprospiraceae bacterium]
SVTPSNGLYSYEWVTTDGNIIGSESDQSVTVSEPGIYLVTVTDENNCTKTAFNNVDGDGTIPEFVIIGDSVIGCNANFVYFEAFPTLEGTEYNWTLPDNTQIDGDFLITDEVGTYTLHAISDNGCEFESQINVIQEIWIPTIQETVPPHLDCHNSFVPLAIYINGDYVQVNWILPDGSEIDDAGSEFNATMSGIYTYEVTNGLYCSLTDTILVIEDETFIAELGTIDTLNCQLENIILPLSIQGEVETISWYFNNEIFSMEQNPEVSEPGLYTVYIEDNNLCEMTLGVEVVGDFQMPIADVSIIPIDCDLGYGTFHINSTTADQFYWTDGTQQVSDIDANFIIAGDYDLVLVGSNGCQDTMTYFLPSNQNFPTIIKDIEGISCKNPIGKINIVSNLPATIDWMGPDTLQGVGTPILTEIPGKYSFVITTDSGCVLVDTIDLAVDTIVPNVVANFDTISCKNPIAGIDISYMSDHWQWQFPDGQTTTDSLPTIQQKGLYHLFLENDNGCTDTLVYTVESRTEKPDFLVDYGVLNCKDSFTIISVSDSNITYSLIYNNLEEEFDDQIQVDHPGIYHVKGMNDWGCDTIMTVEIEQDTTPPSFVMEDVYLSCKITDTILGFPNDDYSYFWVTNESDSLESPIININEDSYQYTLFAIDTLNGCHAMANINVLFDTITPTVSIFIPDLDCNSTNVIPEIENTDFEFANWYGPSGFFSNELFPQIESGGQYTLEIEAENGCKNSASQFVETHFDTTDFLLQYESFNCDNPEVNLQAFSSGYHEYEINLDGQWQFFEDSIPLTLPGNYSVRLVNEFGCISEKEIIILDDSYYEPILLPEVELNCKMASGELYNLYENNEDSKVIWYTDNGILDQDTILVESEGWYYLHIRTEHGCVTEDSVYVDENMTIPSIEIYGDTLIGCDLKNVSLEAQTDVSQPSFNWTTNSFELAKTQSIVVDQAGIYMVSVVNEDNGCKNDASIIVSPLPLPYIGMVDYYQAICEGETSTLDDFEIIGGTEPYSIFYDGHALTDLLPINLTEGSHEFSILDKNGCLADTSFMISEPQLIEVWVDPQIEIDLFDTAQLHAMTNLEIEDIESIEWTPSEGLSCDDCLNPSFDGIEDTHYSIEIISALGCIATANVFVDVNFQKGVIAPNVFSPGDRNGVNDYFTLYAVNKSIEEIEYLKIYDRWGSLVFQNDHFISDTPELGWNGIFQGVNVSPGVFVFTAIVHYLDGSSERISGDITVLK